jgi:hypothetical protein
MFESYRIPNIPDEDSSAETKELVRGHERLGRRAAAREHSYR